MDSSEPRKGYRVIDRFRGTLAQIDKHSRTLADMAPQIQSYAKTKQRITKLQRDLDHFSSRTSITIGKTIDGLREHTSQQAAIAYPNAVRVNSAYDRVVGMESSAYRESPISDTPPNLGIPTTGPATAMAAHPSVQPVSLALPSPMESIRNPSTSLDLVNPHDSAPLSPLGGMDSKTEMDAEQREHSNSDDDSDSDF